MVLEYFCEAFSPKTKCQIAIELWNLGASSNQDRIVSNSNLLFVKFHEVKEF